MKYLSIQEVLLAERRKNAAMRAETDRNTANIDYIAMMTDIELVDNSEEEVHNEE